MKKDSSPVTTRYLKTSLYWEDAALMVILGVLVLRAVFIEVGYFTPPVPSLFLPPPVISLLISFLLLLVFFIHQGTAFWRPWPRPPCFQLVLIAFLFVLLGCLSAAAASNKRDALTELTTLAAPLLIVSTAAELFHKSNRIILFLWVLVALGITAVYQCREQALSDNEAVLQNYEQNPQKVLQDLGIEAGTLKHWQFEHRLRSKDVRGFLTTSNSTGSFLLLCLFANLGLLVYAFRQPPSQEKPIQILLYVASGAFLLYGLFLCKSRGALTAGSLCLAGWFFCLWLGKRLWPYRKMLTALGLLSAAAVVCVAIFYGLRHGRLPGPNAMLVRWQYWVSTVQMIADHPMRGIGGGNFPIWYPLYKIPAAPELIRDPHNFLLSLAAQYGLPAAALFTTLLILPLTAILQSARPSEQPLPAESPSLNTGLILLAVSATVLLIVRPWVTEQTEADADPASRGAFYLVFYLAPAGVMFLAFGLFLLAGRTPTHPLILSRALLPALGWGVLAVLIHNLIDFAIFETAVLTALALCLAAVWSFVAPSGGPPFSNPFGRRMVLILLSAVFAAWTYGAVILPFQAGLSIQQAFRKPAESLRLLQKAEAKDPFSPQAAWYLGQMLFQQVETKKPDTDDLFDKAENAFLRALKRNPADYRLMEAMGDLFHVRADLETSSPLQKQYYQKSYHWLLEAWQHFPGSDRLTFKLGMLSEQNDRLEEAAGWYALAVKIEDDYRKQFEQMYPDYPIFSRLGDGRYQYAKDFLQSPERNPSETENKTPGP